MSYHDLLNLYGDGERLEAEHREFVYVRQPKRYKTPEDIARKDADIARQIERMERLIDDLRDYRVALAQRYAELETMPYTRVLTLKRDPSYKGRITYWVTITRRMSDGTEIDELREQYAGQDRAKAFARFAAQRKSLMQWCADRAYDVLDVYADEGISAKDIKHRPEMLRLLTDVQSGSIDVVCVWSLSRLTRSVADLYSVWGMFAAHGCALISYTEAFDTTTPTGRAMMGMLGIFAQMEREFTAERVSAAIAERAAQGKRTCNEILGYDLDGKDSLKINESEAKRVRYIFDRYLDYHSLSAVAELCSLRGYTGKRGRVQTAESIRRVLTCAVYAGYNSYKGQLYKGYHTPIISVGDYNRVQRLLQKHGKGCKHLYQQIHPCANS